MNGAVIALTPRGRILALKIRETTGLTAYLPRKIIQPGDGAVPFVSLRETLAENFNSRRALVLIMAAGIAVRLLAPLLQDKRRDPAVILLDEKGRYAVPLLSGHWGGANALAESLAATLGAVPVITTATDIGGLKAVDVLASELGVRPEPFARVKEFSAAMLRGESVAVFSELALPESYSGGGLMFFPLSDYARLKSSYNCRALLTHLHCYPESDGNELYLRPPSLFLGVGCRRGITAEKIIKTIDTVLARFNLAAGSVAGLASLEIKKDEHGLVRAAGRLKVPLLFFSVEEVEKLAAEYQESSFVYRSVGVKGVCEPAAMLAAGTGSLLVTKQKMDGVTVAVAQADYPWSASGRETNRP